MDGWFQSRSTMPRSVSRPRRRAASVNVSQFGTSYQIRTPTSSAASRYRGSGTLMWCRSMFSPSERAFRISSLTYSSDGVRVDRVGIEVLVERAAKVDRRSPFRKEFPVVAPSNVRNPKRTLSGSLPTTDRHEACRERGLGTPEPRARQSRFESVPRFTRSGLLRAPPDRLAVGRSPSPPSSSPRTSWPRPDPRSGTSMAKRPSAPAET